METYLPYLRRQPLFRGLSDEEILHLLACVHARELRFDRARTIQEVGTHWGIVAEGGVMEQLLDARGNRTILCDYGPGDFLDTGIAEPGAPPVSFHVRAGTVLLLLDSGAAAEPCEDLCRAHLLFLRNAAQALAHREKLLLCKIEYMSKRSTREKIMCYLRQQSARQGARRLNIPYSRQELADFLAVDRSAMCAELSHMQSDGVIRYERRRFEVLGEG